MFFSQDSVNSVSKDFEKHLMYNMPFSEDQRCCSYDLPRMIRDRANMEQLNAFFSEVIWALPFENEDDHFLDPEIWSVLGRKNGKKYKWSRWSFSDSTYYTNLQTFCGVEDFKYWTPIVGVLARQLPDPNGIITIYLIEHYWP